MLFRARGEGEVDRTIGLVLRLRGPLHCVVNVLDTVVPELLILYLFFWKRSGCLCEIFFEFFWAIAGPVLKMVAVDHHAYSNFSKRQFFWPCRGHAYCAMPANGTKTVQKEVAFIAQCRIMVI